MTMRPTRSVQSQRRHPSPGATASTWSLRALVGLALLALLPGCAYLDGGQQGGPGAQSGTSAIEVTVLDGMGEEAETFPPGAAITVDTLIVNDSPTALSYSADRSWYLDVHDQLGNLVYSEHRLGVATGSVAIPSGASLDLGTRKHWNQLDNGGNQVLPGAYSVDAVTELGTASRLVYIAVSN